MFSNLGQNGGSRTDTLIKLVLIFFVSLLSFSVGTFVGKQFSDSQHKRAMLEAEYDGGSRSTASVPEDSVEVKPEDALTETDIQKIADEFTKPEEKDDHKAESDSHAIAESHEIKEHKGATEMVNAHGASQEIRNVAATHSAPTATKEVAPKTATTHDADHTAKAPATKAPLNAAEKIAKDMAPSENKPEPVKHVITNLPTNVSASSIGKFTIQISSHQSEDQAKAQATDLKSKGFSAFVVPATVKGRQWYRVSVGLFDKMPEAKNYREKFIKESGVSSAIVQQIVQ